MPAVSARMESVLRDAPAEGVTVDWLLGHLFNRSPEFLLLAFTPIAIVPATSTLAGIVLLAVAGPLILHRGGFPVPRFLARRRIPRARVERAVKMSAGLLKRYEAYALAHPHPLTGPHTLLTGVLILALSSALLVPLPFSNVLPGLTIGTVAIASLEQDRRLFVVATCLTAISLLLVLMEGFSGYHLAATLL